MAGNKLPTETKASDQEVDAFIRRLQLAPRPAAGGRRGRLMFVLDATASRAPTWDRACTIQAEMFQEAASLGGLEMQVCFFRGFGEFRATPWLTDPKDMIRRMTGVHCLGGQTQIGRMLGHALAEMKKSRLDAVVFVGDCLEEPIDPLCAQAGELGLLGLPVFLFHEGGDPVAASGFRQIAKLTKGAYCPFDGASAQQLRDLLRAVAVYAAGGRKALADFARRTGGPVLALTHQVK